MKKVNVEEAVGMTLFHDIAAMRYGFKGDEIAARIRRAVNTKPPCHEEQSYIRRSQAGRATNEIGG